MREALKMLSTRTWLPSLFILSVGMLGGCEEDNPARERGETGKDVIDSGRVDTDDARDRGRDIERDTGGDLRSGEVSEMDGDDGRSLPGRWVRHIGTDRVDRAHGMTATPSGMVYTVGKSDGDVGDVENAGGGDAFVAKHDARGNRQWVQLVGSSDRDNASTVASDGNGSIYVGGLTNGDLGDQTHQRRSDGFIAKLTASGEQTWVRLLGTSEVDGVKGIATDASGFVYVTGYTQGDLFGNTNSGGISDAFVAKYDPDGNRQWVRLLGTPKTDRGLSVATSGAIYIGGRTSGGLADESFRGGTHDGFIAKYSTEGDREWVRLVGTPEPEHVRGVAAEGADGVYVTGKTRGELGGSQGTDGRHDAFVARYDESGDRQWAKLLGNASVNVAHGATTDAAGHLYLVGRSKRDLAGQANNGGLDGFAASYDSSGNRRWVRLIGTPELDGARGIGAFGTRNVFVAGKTRGELHAGTAHRGYDAFVAKVQ